MFSQITNFQIFSLPLVAWFGALCLICILFTAYISVMNKKGKTKIPFKWHPIMAKISITLILIHAGLSLVKYF